MNGTTRLSLAAIACVALLCACGGPAHPRLTELSNSDGSRVLMTYTGDKLATVKVLDKNGTVSADITATYNGDKIASMTYKGSGDPVVYNYTYADGKLASVGYTNGDSTYSNTFTYADGRISRIALSVGSSQGSVNSSSDYTYAEGKLLRRTNTYSVKAGGLSYTATTTDDFAHDDKGRLIMVTTTGGTDIKIVTLTYDESGRLKSVLDSGSTYTVEYVDGKVSRTMVQNGSTTETTTYTYDGGDVAGVIANPIVSFGDQFDLAGQRLPYDQVYVTSALMGMNSN